MEWRWWSDDAVFRFFHGLLYLANLADNGYKNKTVERGSFITSIPSLCTTLQMSEKKVRRCLKCLVSTGEIIDEPTNHDRKITIVNYALYQDPNAIQPPPKRKGKGQDSGKGKGKGKGSPIKERKKYKSPTGSCTEKAASRAPSEEPAAAAPVTYVDVRQYQIDNRIGCGEAASEFSSGFEKSGTKFPPDWQKVYRAFVKADEADRERFLNKLSTGGFRDKWGAVE